MSRQINFYIGPSDQLKLAEYIKEKGIVALNRHGREIDVSSPETNYLLLSRREFIPGFEYRDNGDIDCFSSYIIEYSRTNVSLEKSFVSLGRFWYGKRPGEGEENELKSKQIMKDYNGLKNWIKKNIPYQTYYRRGVALKGYISDELLKYGEMDFWFW